MANGHGLPLIQNLIRERAYQQELVELMCSLTQEDANGRVTAAKTAPAAIDAIIAFRRKHGLAILDCDPAFYLIAMHRAIIRHPKLKERADKMPPDEDAMRARGVINWSEHWLIRNGYGTDVDTEFNPKPVKVTQ